MLKVKNRPQEGIRLYGCCVHALDLVLGGVGIPRPGIAFEQAHTIDVTGAKGESL